MRISSSLMRRPKVSRFWSASSTSARLLVSIIAASSGTGSGAPCRHRLAHSFREHGQPPLMMQPPFAHGSQESPSHW
jgi:hypothetical protein